MYSFCNSEDSACQLKESCGSHVSIYYEQKQQEEILTKQQSTDSCSHTKISNSFPVEIHEEETTSIELPPLIWHGYENPPKILSVTNTGRTILINGHWMNSRPYIEGGPLNGNYLFSQIHFHCPSEHEIDGRRYPLEMHLVHYKTSYLTQERAMCEKDGTVVLVYLFKLMDTRNSDSTTAISQITKLAPELVKLNSRTETTEIFLDQLIRPFFSNYYVYWGSVYTQKKSYLLQWIISCSLLDVTQEEVDDLSNIITSAGLTTDKQITRMKPVCDAVFHVGDDDYYFPTMKTISMNDVANVCRCHEVGYAASDSEWKRANMQDDDYGSTCSTHGRKSKKSKKKRGSKRKSKGNDNETALSCESTNGSSRSSIGNEKPDKKKKKKKKEKKSKKRKRSGDCNSECEYEFESGKSSSKSSVCDDVKNKSKKRSNKNETQADLELGYECESSKSSATSISEERSKTMREKKKTHTRNQEEEKKLECDDENDKVDVKERSKAEEDEEHSKKKQKKSQKSSKKHKSPTENRSKEAMDADADFCKAKSVCTPILVSPKSSICDYSTNSVMMTNDIQDCETKASSNCMITLKESSSSSSCDTKKKVTVNTCGDMIVKSSGVISFLKSKCPVKFDNSDCCEAQVQISKTSMMEENECFETPSSKSKPSLCIGSQSEVGRNKREKPAACRTQSFQEVQKSNAGKEMCESNSKTSKEKKKSNNKLDKSSNQVMFKSKDDVKKESKGVGKSKEDIRGGNKGVNKSKEDIRGSNKGASKSKEDVRGSNKAVCKSKEDMKGSNKAVNRSKEDMKGSNKAVNRSKEDMKGSNKAVNRSKENMKGKAVNKSKEEMKESKKAVCRSNEDLKGSNKTVRKSKEDVKGSSKTVQKSKEDIKGSSKAARKSKEDVRRSSKANFSGQDITLDCRDDITTLYEKKQVDKKIGRFEDDCNDVQINFLLTPCVKATTSNRSCTITTSESDFTEEKKIDVDLKESRNFIVQNFTVDATPIPESEVPADKFKKNSQVCLLMEHLFRTENKEGQVYKCNSQEYNVAIMCDQNVLQEYKGKFHPQELQVGNDEVLQLVPKYPEPEDSSIRLQDCTVKKESLDQFCIRVKFLLKEFKFRRIFSEMENGFNKNKEKEARELYDEETQYSYLELDLTEKLHSKPPEKSENKEKIITDGERTEISNSESIAKIVQDQQTQQTDMLPCVEEVMGSQKCTIKLEKTPDICSQDIYGPSHADEDLKELKMMNTNKNDKAYSEKTDKKLKPLFVKRRKTVYFMYDKVEKDESTGKKVFVGSFRTKEEVENMKKQKELLEEIESVNASGKSSETPETKHGTSCAKKEVDLKVKKSEPSPKSKTSSPGRKCPPTSKGAPSNKKNDLVTLHKYKPKYSGTNRPKKDCKNVLVGKVVNNLQRGSEMAGVKNKKAPQKTFEVQEVKESELQKETPDPGSSKTSSKSKTKNMSLATNQVAHSEVIVPEKSNKAEEDSAVDDSQKSLDKNESQAGLILVPVEVESLSKIEVILIEHLDGLKKHKKRR